MIILLLYRSCKNLQNRLITKSSKMWGLLCKFAYVLYLKFSKYEQLTFENTKAVFHFIIVYASFSFLRSHLEELYFFFLLVGFNCYSCYSMYINFSFLGLNWFEELWRRWKSEVEVCLILSLWRYSSIFCAVQSQTKNRHVLY